MTRGARFSPWSLRSSLISTLVLAGLSTPALAQSALDEAARQARQFQNQQSEQQRLREIEQLQRSNRAPMGELPKAPVPTTSAKGERCFDIKTITVDGAKIIPADIIHTTVSAWEGRCLALAEINSVLKALTFLYVERGYVASRAFLPQQNLKSGTLVVSVVEGTLDAIRLNGQPDESGVIGSAFPGLTGSPVNLRDLEQGLDQINRLRSNNAIIAIAAGQNAGSSVLDVTNNPGNRVHAAFGSDTLGATVSGIYQSRVDLAIDNLFGLNDLWQFGYQRSMSRSPAFFSGERPNGDAVNASFSVPYGYWTFGVDGSWSQYHSSVQGQIAPIDISGDMLLISPYVSAVIQRDQVSRTSVTGRLTWKATVNDILGSRIDVASRTLSIASIELNHSRQFLGGQASASLGYQQGLSVLGAFDDATAPAGSPKGQFSKLTASLGYYRPFDLGTVTPIYSGYVLGQWTPDRLFGSEQMALGGYSTVRGVRDAVLFADKGVLARNELSLLLPTPEPNDLATIFGRIEPYVALDVGYAAQSHGDAGGGGTLVGAAVGLRNRGGRLAFDVWYANLISQPDMPAASRPATGLVQGRISVSF